MTTITLRPALGLGALALALSLSLACKSDDPGDDSPSFSDSNGDDDGTDDAETTEDDVGDESDDFLPGGDMPNANACDPFSKDCPDGEKCVPYISGGGDTWDANKCVPVMGDGVSGDQCVTDSLTEGTDSCNGDNLCWQLVYDDQNQLVGTCLPYCGGSLDEPACENNGICQITNSGVVNVCVDACDPLLQDCGLEGVGCYIAGGQDFFTCQPISGGYEDAAPCIYTNDCLPGLFCSAGEAVPGCNSSGCCTNYCDLTDGSACDGKPDTECVAFFETPSPIYENLGVCISPL